jgi:predicted Holliday junction resolvase-like endonuclease
VFEELEDGFQRLQTKSDRFDSLEEKKREAARQLGQFAAKKRIRAICPFFVDQKIDPGDVKVLFHPVDYVVFKGMGRGRCASVDFIDHAPKSRNREIIQRTLDRAIRAGNMEWETFRVDENGRVTLDGSGHR